MSIEADTRNLAKWLNEEQTAPIDRQALARVLAHLQQPAQQQEPVYYQWRRKNMDWDTNLIFEYQVEATTDDSEVRMLYTSPPPRKPLTDEEIVNVAKSIGIEFKDEGLAEQVDDILTFARAIEAAHGIKGDA